MADKTYANLSVDTSLSNSDLIAFYPVGGPLRVIAYQNLLSEISSGLAGDFLTVLNNLSDINSAGVARTNLGLGSAAVKNTGTTSDTIAVLGANGKAPISTLPGGYIAKSANYTVAAADNGKLIDCTGTFTLSVPDASVVGETFSFDVRNSGTGVITIAPAAGLVDGASSRTQDPGTTRYYVTNGTNYFSTSDNQSVWTLLDTKSTTSGTSVTFSSISQNYAEILLELDGVTISSGALAVAFSSDGSSFSTAWQVTGAGTSVAYDGQITLPKYTAKVTTALVSLANAASSPPETQQPILGTGGDNRRVVRTPSGVKAVSVSSTSAAFSAGEIRLYGR